MMKYFFSMLLSALLGSVVLAQQNKQPIVTSDLLNMKTAGQIAVSSDGSQAIYVVTRIVADKEQDYKYQHHLWIADLQEENITTRQLTFGDRNDGQPVWSPDGSRIAFVRTDDDKPQVWILPLTGGEAYRLTHARHGAGNPRWSPDGNSILFTSGLPMAEMEGQPAWTYERPGRTYGDEPAYLSGEAADSTVTASPDGDLKTIRAWLARNASRENPAVINRLDFLGETGVDNDPRFSHLFVIPLNDTTQVKQLTQGFQSYHAPQWSPDGQRIVCSSIGDQHNPDRELKSELWIVEADGTEASILLSMEGQRLFQPQFSPDGSRLLFLAAGLDQITYAQTELGIVEADGSKARILTQSFDREVYLPQWSDSGNAIYFVAPEQGYFPLYHLSVRAGKVKKVVETPYGLSDYDLSQDRLVFAATTVEQPYEIYLTNTKGSEIQQITSFNTGWLQNKLVATPSSHSVQHDGRSIQYWVMPPMGREQGQKYPVVLEMHGGPSAMWGPGEFSMWLEFQLLCSWGYGVVYANPRGSGGYGSDFQKANYRDWGKGPAGDVLSALEDALQQHQWMDSKQLFLTGGSYAGYLTAWIISQDKRFEAAVAQRGVYDLKFFFGEGNAWRLVPDHFGGFPWEPEALAAMESNSPQTFVADIETPLLIMHADKDLRTGVRQSELLYKSLKVLNKPVEYVRYPDEGHELSRSGNPLRRMDRLNRIIEFFERFVEHPASPPATQKSSPAEKKARE